MKDPSMWTEATPTPDAPVIVDPQGRPARRRQAPETSCPGCGADQDRRIASCGFGLRGTICGQCGHDFHEAWHD